MALKPPWRSQDICDVILGRPSRPTLPVVAVQGDADEASDLVGPHVNELYVIFHETEAGLQPLIWPMDVHHPQDPDRRGDH